MKIALKTDIGQKRSNNQDCVNKFVNNREQVLILLADGMGGHKSGHIASERTVMDMGRKWINTDFGEGDWEQIRDWFLQVIEEQNQLIYSMGQTEEHKGMGTTIEAVALVGNFVIFAHVGDSRIGIVRDGVYHLLTNDHSLVNALLHAGQITPEEAAVHPQKNVIIQAIGQESPVAPDIDIHELYPGDYLVINSDGLTNMIGNERIEDIMSRGVSLEQKSRLLVAAANEAGGLDNITVALVHIESEGQV